MRRYLLRRLMLIPLTLLGITFVVFCLSRMVPGGPVERMLQEQANENFMTIFSCLINSFFNFRTNCLMISNNCSINI